MDNPFEILIQQMKSMDERLVAIQQSICLAEELLTIKELNINDDVRFDYDGTAKYLKKNKSTIQRYKNNGALPYHQVGRTVYFLKSEIDAAMSSITSKKRGVKI